VSWIGRVKLLIELSSVVAMDQQAQRTFERIGTARKTARRSSQTSQIVTQLGIARFNRIGVCLALRDFISAPVIPEAIIGIQNIAVMESTRISSLFSFIHSLRGVW